MVGFSYDLPVSVALLAALALIFVMGMAVQRGGVGRRCPPRAEILPSAGWDSYPSPAICSSGASDTESLNRIAIRPKIMSAEAASKGWNG